MILFININFLFNQIIVDIDKHIKLIKKNKIKLEISCKVVLTRNTIQKIS